MIKTAPEPRPFTIEVDAAGLDDLQRRLAHVRWPDETPGTGWQTGASLSYMRELVAYWLERYDWPAQVAALNRFRQFTVPLGGIDLHFIHEPGNGPNPMPLLLVHGWPSTAWEFAELIPRLTDPARFGGDPADAFTVVAPSLPGYTFSYQPNQRRFSLPEMADLFATLMREVLGFERFIAAGGDWGSFICSRLAYAHPELLHGLHLLMLPLRRDPGWPHQPTAEEAHYLDQLRYWVKEETAYAAIQGTKPQTLAYGLTDSPVGLAAWIVEKFRTWSDCGGDVERCYTKDQLLTNVMLYWTTGAINSSFWPYYSRLHSDWPIPDGARILVPTGHADFPHEIIRPTRSLAERIFNLVHWTEFPVGGHFAAAEQPDAYAGDLRAFCRGFRSG